MSIELLRKYTGFDLVLAIGVLHHHLTDAEAVDLFRVAKAALKPGGRLVTLDGCFVGGQSPVARRLLKRDRGEYVRHEAGYVALDGMFCPATSASPSDSRLLSGRGLHPENTMRGGFAKTNCWIRATSNRVSPIGAL